jgi:hypothetical protein
MSEHALVHCYLVILEPSRAGRHCSRYIWAARDLRLAQCRRAAKYPRIAQVQSKLSHLITYTIMPRNGICLQPLNASVRSKRSVVSPAKSPSCPGDKWESTSQNRPFRAVSNLNRHVARYG